MHGSRGKARTTVSLSRGSRRISQLSLCEGKFLEAVLPVQAFATLTPPRQFAREHLLDSYRAWVQGLQRHHRLTLGWIRALETRPQRHIHAALIAAGPLDCSFAELLWRSIVAPRYSKAAKVAQYQRGCCGLGYVLKTLDACYEDAEFSPNLTAFALLSSASRANSDQRRQRRRIQAQLEAHRDLGL
jgi:hypothetical protein